MTESQDFSTVLVKDKRIANISDSVSYAVKKGGSNISVSKYRALSGVGSANPSSLVFNLQVPSEQVVVDRAVRLEAELALTITGTIPAGSAVGARLIDWANRDGLGPYPLHQLFSTMTATINNNTVSVQMQQILPALVNMYDRREHNRWLSTTPTMPDNVCDYNDVTNTVANPLGGYSNALDQDLLPRGSFEILSITGNTAYAGPGAEAKTVVVTFKVSEFLMLSPFLWQESPHQQGFLGVQTLNFQFQLSSLNRIYRTSGYCSDGTLASPAKVCSSITFNDANLVFQFLSLHPSDVIPSRNVVPMVELPVFQSSNFPVVNAGATSGQITTSTFSLNQIPDKLIIWANKAQALQTNSDPDFAFVIESISVQFNNSQGIMSNFTQYDLYRASYESGSSQSWNCFKGSATRPDTGNASPAVIKTSGSFLVLDMALQGLAISEDFLAPSSIGQYSLAITLNLRNQTSQNISPVINILTVNSGLFVVDRGQSSSFSGILDKSLVLNASQKESKDSWEVERIIGGAMSSTSASVGMAMKDKKMGCAGPASIGVANGKMQSRYK